MPTFVIAHMFCASHKKVFNSDAINYTTKYTTEMKVTFSNCDKSSLMNLYFKVAKHSFRARFCWCNLARAQGFQKNKHVVNRTIILITQHPHYLCYFPL